MYFLFVLFAAVAVRAPTLALGVTAVALAFKETGPIVLFPSLLLVLGPGIPGLERLRRLAVGATVLLVVTVPVVLAGLLPSVLLSSYAGLFSSFVTGSSTAQPFVSPETYTVWTLFTGFVGGHDLTRFMIDSSTPLVAGLSFALLGTAVFAISWLAMLAFVRKGARSPSLAFWFATTSFGAVTFTALLTGTGSRYYTLALPGLAALVVLAWDRGPWLRSIILAAYAIVTALAFWTMYGVLTVIMSREYPNILGLGLSYNPLSRFVLQWYQDNNVITLGSIGAVAAVLLISYALVDAGPTGAQRTGYDGATGQCSAELAQVGRRRRPRHGLIETRSVGSRRSHLARLWREPSSRSARDASLSLGKKGTTRVLLNCQMQSVCVAADVSGRGLNGSPEGFPRTPRLYRTRLLRMSLKVSLFRGGFGLRCFQPLSRSAWLLSDALPDN